MATFTKKYKYFAITLLLWLFTAPAMAVTVTSSPVSCTDTAGIGTIAWATPGNASALDGAYATFTGRNSEISHYLECTSYNFAIPTTSVINGITVNVADFSGKTMYDYAVQLVKGGAIQATNYGTMTNMRGNSPSYKTYGSATDLWGNTWTPADINSANFGVAFAAQRGPYNSNDTANVDHIQVTIDYTYVAAPTVTTNAATGVTDALATLNGTVNDNGADTTVSFDYGTTVSYGTNVAATPATVTGGSGNTAVSAALTGLTCNTTYHFRVNGTNTSGTNSGLDQTFTTSACPAPPTANTGSATAIASTSATLNGTVNDNGGDTAVSFDYGTTTSYGTNVAATPATVTKGSGVTAVSAALTGLSCNTTYHFRVNGTNSAGTTNGIDSVFTTGACSTTATGSVTASPTLCVSDPSNGSTQTAWTGLTSVGAQDGATATSTMNAGSFSPYLVCTGYGFNLPSGSTVNGISVDYWIASDRSRFVSEQSAQLVKANVVQGSNLSTGASIAQTIGAVTYGGATNLWGSTWTAADINNTGFGAAFAAVNTSGGRTHYAYVDYMPITVYYTYPLTPPTVTSINRAGSDPVASNTSVSWTVVFDQGVSGVDISDFALAPSSGISGAAISSVTETSGTGTNTTWTVTATTGTGAGTLGLNLVDNDSIVVPASGLPLGGTGNGNGDFTGQVYNVMNQCVGGAFGPTLDTNLWTVQTIMGAFTPQIFNAGGGDYRLRLTDANNNEATFAQIKNPFPAYGNKVVLTFDYFSYGGSGADGMAVTFSDATVSSTTGGFGGSLGYAQNTTNPGFGGGWLGIGLDEYGNYPCTNESRTGYPAGWTDPVLGAVTPCGGSGGGNHYVAIRGSGTVAGGGYNLIANTGLIAATAPAGGAAGATPYRYRVILDHSDSVHAYVTVERDTTGTGNSFNTLIPKFDIKGASTQAAVPANWLISFTGSTGGATNNHELKQVEVCANAIAGTSLDHLEIEHASGTGVTCTPSTLTIKACADASCSTPYTLGVTGTVSASGTPTVNWSGGTTFSIPAGFSTVTKDVQVTTPGSVTFSATASSPATSAFTCNFGTPSCTFSSSDSGFLVSAPNHVSESLASLTVQAVKKADNSLACVPAFANTSKTVNFTCSYSDPGSGTLPVRVGGSALNATNSTAAACDATGANVSLSFDASGVATPTLQYADVGQMNVTANYTGTAGSTEAGLSMTGTGTFIAAPAAFAFSGITSGTIKAGNNFGATVTAQNAAGSTTPNFGKESVPEGATLSSTLVSPAGGVNPALGNNTIAGGSFSNGAATVNNLTWGEVGNITLTANLTSASYLGSGLTASGTSATTTGPFVPDHFDTTVSQVSGVPMLCPTGLTCPCPTGATCPPATDNGFVYSGQSFTVNIDALNTTGGMTRNYDGALGFSKQVTLTAWDAPGSTTTQNPGGGALSNNTVPATSFSSGTTTLGTSATPIYTFGTVPTAPTDIYMRAADADATSSTNEDGVKVVSGRIDISNAHGSELLDLPIDVTAQYWNGTSYVTSSTDSVSRFSTTSGGDLTFSNCLPLPPSTVALPYCPPTTYPSSSPVTFSSGTANFTLMKPGSGNTGSVDMSISVPSYLTSNPARATFGVYGGSKNLIYMHEQY